jgi:ABC-type phosphate transport system permease subunit
MKIFFTLVFKALPFSIGMILILTALCFLVEFADQLPYPEDEGVRAFWSFVALTLVGIPTIVCGMNKLSKEKS